MIDKDPSRTLPGGQAQALDFASKIAVEAGEAVLRLRLEEEVLPEAKDDPVSIVSDADHLSEGLIVKRIHEEYPEHSIRGEESTDKQTDSSYEWILDPVDGSMNYLVHEPFGVSVGLLFEGEPILGAINYPNIKSSETIFGGEGLGVHSSKDGQIELKPISTKIPLIGFDFSAAGARLEENENILKPLIADNWYPIIAACATTSVRALLQGKLHAYVHPGATPFDLAAAVSIAKAVGCVVSGITEEYPLDFNQERIPVIIAKDQETMDRINKAYS